MNDTVSSNKLMINRLSVPLVLLWPVGLVLVQFRFFELGGFQVTLGVFFTTFIILYLALLSRIRKTHLLMAMLAIIYALAMGYSARAPVEFLKSFALMVNLLLVVLLTTGVALPPGKLIERSVGIFLYLAAAVAVFIILQAVTLNVLGSTALLNPFGPFSFPGPGGVTYEVHQLSALKRPNGVFSEPSVAGWFMTYSAAVAFASPALCGKRRSVTALLCLVAAVSSISLSGFLNVSVLLFTFMYVNRTRGWIRVAASIGIVVMLVSFIAVFVYLGISKRSADLFVEGTSTYYRLTAPVMLLSDSLPEHPLGHALGQTDYIDTKDYMVNWSEGSNTNIDNSFFFISYYFGVPGIVVSLAAIWYMTQLVLRRSMAGLIVLALVLALAETGSLWSHTMALIIGYTVILVRHIRLNEPPSRCLVFFRPRLPSTRAGSGEGIL